MAKQRPSTQKRDREFRKRDRERKKREKAAIKRERRKDHRDAGTVPGTVAGDDAAVQQASDEEKG